MRLAHFVTDISLLKEHQNGSLYCESATAQPHISPQFLGYSSAHQDASLAAWLCLLSTLMSAC
jgi:hypothetical protein